MKNLIVTSLIGTLVAALGVMVIPSAGIAADVYTCTNPKTHTVVEYVCGGTCPTGTIPTLLMPPTACQTANVHGTILTDGTIASEHPNNSFTVDHGSTGYYVLTFKTPYAAGQPPNCIISPISGIAPTENGWQFTFVSCTAMIAEAKVPKAPGPPGPTLDELLVDCQCAWGTYANGNCCAIQNEYVQSCDAQFTFLCMPTD